MANATFNAGIDYFGLETATTNALKVKSSAENRSKQSASGANSYGDVTVVDSYGETAAPSAEYEVIDDVDSTSLAEIGGKIIDAANGFDVPLCVGGITFETKNGSAPTMSAAGQLVQEGAARLRVYSPIAFTISPRHRAQNCVGTFAGETFTPAVEIKKGVAVASDIDDYGLESVGGGLMPIVITTSMPKGTIASYDLHGEQAMVNYSMNWYDATEPTISLSAAAVTAGFTMSAPASKTSPEGYVTYSWSIAAPITGIEYVEP